MFTSYINTDTIDRTTLHWLPSIREVNPKPRLYVYKLTSTRIDQSTIKQCLSARYATYRGTHYRISDRFQYELDSLAGFLKIARSYYANTKDASFINDNCELRNS